MSDTSGSEPSAPVVVPNRARTNRDIKVAVNKWCENPIEAEAIYGHISFWDVSTITSMRRLFYFKRSFNEDLSRWNVSACTDMEAMFRGASSFTSDLSEWIVMEGTNVGGNIFGGPRGMFEGCPCDDFRPVWEERRQVQKRKDECWERRLPWMVANAPYLQGERRTEAPIQMVYDIDGLFEFITTYI